MFLGNNEATAYKPVKSYQQDIQLLHRNRTSADISVQNTTKVIWSALSINVPQYKHQKK